MNRFEGLERYVHRVRSAHAKFLELGPASFPLGVNLGTVVLMVPVLVSDLSLRAGCCVSAAVLAATVPIGLWVRDARSDLRAWFAGLCMLGALVSVVPVLTPLVGVAGLVALFRHQPLGWWEMGPGGRILGVQVVVPVLCGLYYGLYPFLSASSR